MANFNYNRVILGGRLTADVELKTTTSGIPVCSFSVAVNRKFTSKDSQEGAQTADFINCVASRQTAEFISKYFRKGSSIALEGSLQTRTWTDNNQQKRFATEVVVDQAMFVDSKADGSRESYSSQPSYPSQPDYTSQPAEPNFESISNDNDLPF